MSLLPIRMQSSPPHRVALHAARVGPGLEDAVFLGGGAHAALRPVLADLDAMAALPELCDRRRAEPSLDDEAAGSRLARIEGTREVLVMEGRSEEHTSEPQSLMRNSIAGFGLTKQP